MLSLHMSKPTVFKTAWKVMLQKKILEIESPESVFWHIFVYLEISANCIFIFGL